MRLVLALWISAALGVQANAQEKVVDGDAVLYTVDQTHEDVFFGLENAILNEGLVIDSTSHVGEMLDRTKEDVGSEVDLFFEADVVSFCSATLSRKVMEADPRNIRYCPYDIFLYALPDNPEQTVIGYRTFPEGPMKEVETLLDGVVRAAIGLD